MIYDDMYGALGDRVTQDDDGTTSGFVRALSSMFQQVDDYISPDDTHGIWGRLMDVDMAPDEALPWVALFAGARLAPGLTADQQREVIKEQGALRRGTVPSMRSALRRHLTGSKFVSVVERDGSVGRITFNTRTSQTPDPDAALESLMEQKPAGLILVHQMISGADYATIKSTYATYADLKNSG